MVSFRHHMSITRVEKQWWDDLFSEILDELGRLPPAKRNATVPVDTEGERDAHVSAALHEGNLREGAVVELSGKGLLVSGDALSGRVETAEAQRQSGRGECAYHALGGHPDPGSLYCLRVHADTRGDLWWRETRDEAGPAPIAISFTHPLITMVLTAHPEAVDGRWDVTVDSRIDGMWWMVPLVLLSLKRPGRGIRRRYEERHQRRIPADPDCVSGGVRAEHVLPGQAVIERKLRKALVSIASEWNHVVPALTNRDPREVAREKVRGVIGWRLGCRGRSPGTGPRP